MKNQLSLLFMSFLCESKQSSIPQAVLQLVQSFYGESSVTLQVYYNSDRLEIVDETLKLLSGVKQLNVTKVDKILPFWNNEYVYNDAIFLFDTMENYAYFLYNLIAYEKINIWEKLSLLIYCEDWTRLKAESIITKHSFNTFLIEENKEISLHAMTMYTDKKCNVPQLIEINRFCVQHNKWTTDKFLGMTMNNFYGCALYIDAFTDDWPFTKIEFFDQKKSVTAEGVLIEMLELLSTAYNFTIIYIPTERSSDLSWYVRAAPLERDWQKNYFLSDPIYSDSKVIIVPRGESYTPWEKLYLTFDEATWMWLGIFFAVAFFVILLAKISRSSSIYDFVVGSNVTTPSLNVIAIFMGIGQILLPQRNVSRFMFVSFILFSLIMSTAYQEKYFEFITGDVRKKPITTVAEIISKNYTFYWEDEGAFDSLFDAMFNDNLKG